MSDALKQQTRAFVVALAPVVLAVGVVVHPYISDFNDTGEVAAAASDSPSTWAFSHALLIVGFALLILAAFAIRFHLHDAGEDRWSFWATPLLTVGGGILAAYMGLEGLGGYAVAEAGGSVEGFYEAGSNLLWFFLIGAAAFSVGILVLAGAIHVSGVLSRAMRWTVIASLVVATVGNLIPASWASYVGAAATLIGFGIVATSMWPPTETSPIPPIA